MKIIRQHLLLILIAALCCGCGGSSDDGGGTKKKGLIGYSAMSLTNPFFKIIADSITEEAGLNGFDVAVNDANSDGKLQAEHIDSYIVQGAQAIILNPCDRLSVGPAIQKANKAGIPVFTCDLQCVAEGVKITGHIGTDNFQGGQLAGKAMIELLGETGGKVL
ncbi:MAG: substrate-binding domain-containing protein, partial [Planctomycetota bacterium]|nr:substrate-binding domain-containing protein [Planctomycetota bacterium]